MPSIDTIVYALWLMYLKKLSNEYVQQTHVFFMQWFCDVIFLIEQFIQWNEIFIKITYDTISKH